MTSASGGMPNISQARPAHQRRVRLIAFYLPQFHPIPENDAWWGKGFTEWTNVAQARPLFPGHYQPHIPADLGFYDLRVPETRAAQAEMARQYGIEGFCYWHYWFAGKRLLERPFAEVLKSGQPDFPFCLAWANQSWTGIWHGAPSRILIEQTYPGMDDYVNHFNALLDALGDSRYITIDDKPVFVVFNPSGLPEPKRFTDCWRELATKAGLKGLYLVGVATLEWIPQEHGFDASILNNPGMALSKPGGKTIGYLNKIVRGMVNQSIGRLNGHGLPTVYSYKDVIRYALPESGPGAAQFPCVIPNWDNTPRSGAGGIVLYNSTPEAFRIHLERSIEWVARGEPDNRIIFVKSWNEWAEGNHLEPDQRYARGYLQVIRDLVMRGD